MGGGGLPHLEGTKHPTYRGEGWGVKATVPPSPRAGEAPALPVLALVLGSFLHLHLGLPQLVLLHGVNAIFSKVGGGQGTHAPEGGTLGNALGLKGGIGRSDMGFKGDLVGGQGGGVHHSDTMIDYL